MKNLEYWKARALKAEAKLPKVQIGGSNKPQANEIPYKVWLIEKAEPLGISIGAMHNRIWRGLIPKPQMRKVNSRVIFVKTN